MLQTNLQEKNGLSTSKAQELLNKFGPNKLPETPPPSDVQIFVSQLKSPLVYVLLVAAAITFFLKDFSDFVIIAIAILLNTILGFYQERRAGRALEALKQMLHSESQVYRDGKLQQIDAVSLVPGDLVVLNAGDKVPADGKVREINRLFISESLLTGESVPIEKQLDAEVFMGTVVQAGRGIFEIKKTGAKTEMGKIAQTVQEINEDTPLKKQLKKFSNQLSILVLITTGMVFVLGLVVGLDLATIFKTSVALAVSAIPEGLLVALTVVLAIGMQRILKRKGLVRNLVSAETLGGVTTICLDKTGTLTQGKMSVANQIGEEDVLAMQVLIANDMDDPIVIAGAEWGKQKISVSDIKEFQKQYKRLDSLPFNSEQRFFASLNKFDEKNNVIFVNGAPEFLIDWSDLSKHEKDELNQKVAQLSGEGKRIIGFAQKQVATDKKSIDSKDIEGANLKWIGLLAFSDPVRPSVKESLKQAQASGINLIVITGDYAQTAKAVLGKLEIDVEENSTMLGTDLRKLSMNELTTWLDKNSKVKLFARTKPDQKLKIIQALKNNGEVVAMMGDGVNDAPALSKSDIGVVVGEATDVAKESADLVLLDSSFTTIIAAIEEGRGIFDNLRKIILFLMSDAFQAIIAIMVCLALFLPVPVTASQILWINLISDGFPSLALTVDPKISGIMARPPRSPKEPLVTNWMKQLITIVSLAGGLATVLIFYFTYKYTGDNLEFARSVAFAALGVNSSVYVFSVRTLTKPFWTENPFENKQLILGVIGSLILQFLPFAVPALRDVFGIVPIGNYWFAAFGVALVMFIVIELCKLIFRHEKHLT